MANLTYTRDLYNLLTDGFREAPGNASHAARVAGVDPRTARRAWQKGWPKFSWGIPIREVIRREMEAARTEREKKLTADREQQQRDREKARADAVRATAEEAQAASIARANGIAAGALIQSLLRSMVPLTKKLQESMEGADLKPREMAKMLGDAAYIVRQGNEAIKTAFELERIRVGEPTQVIGVTSMDNVSPEEAAQDLVALARTLHRQVKTHKKQNMVPTEDGTYVIELPDEAYEEGDGAAVVPIKKAAR